MSAKAHIKFDPNPPKMSSIAIMITTFQPTLERRASLQLTPRYESDFELCCIKAFFMIGEVLLFNFTLKGIRYPRN